MFFHSLTVIPTIIASQNVIGSQTTIVQTCSQASSAPPFHPTLSDSTTSATSTPTPFVEGVLIWKKYQRIREHGQKVGMSQKINVCVFHMQLCRFPSSKFWLPPDCYTDRQRTN